MSRVIAFSCAHISTPKTQRYLHGKTYGYENLKRLIEIIIYDPPDLVVNLGDFQELLYEPDGIYRTAVPEYDNMPCPVIKLCGNHDKKQGALRHVMGPVRYEHGHIGTRARDVESIRRRFANTRTVHGHSHEPKAGWPLDVGSITFTGTYGEIINGESFLRHV